MLVTKHHGRIQGIKYEISIWHHDYEDGQFSYQFKFGAYANCKQGSYYSVDDALEAALVDLDRTSQRTGFTLIELLIVMIIIGILGAIAAPAWLRFTEKQRINAANGAIYRAIQQVQSDAKRQAQMLTIEFRQADQPEYTIHRDNPLWRPLAADTIGMTITPIRMQFNAKGNPVLTPPASLPAKVIVTKGNLKRCTSVVTLLGATRQGEDDACN